MANVCALPGCSKQRYEAKGTLHDFCGRTHAREAEALEFRGQKICQLEGCSTNVFVEAETGRSHDFCSHTHAHKAIESGQWPPANARGNVQCKLKECVNPVFIDPRTGREFFALMDVVYGYHTAESEFCSRSHLSLAEAMIARQCIRPECKKDAWIDADTGGPLDYCSSECAVLTGMSSLCGGSECDLPGCGKQTLVNSDTRKELSYCSEAHRLRAVQLWLGPRNELYVDRTYRGGTSSATDFELSLLTNAHPDYVELKKTFLDRWRKPEYIRRVSVLRVFKIGVPADIRKTNLEYQEFVGNVKERIFHGTSCSTDCSFYVDLKGGPCGRRDCSVCNICTHGFKLTGHVGRTAQLVNFNLRYGEGLYFSSVSGKANDYATLSEKKDKQGRTVRCMFMASVAKGIPFTTKDGSLEDDMCPPEGYDSVVGEAGKDLNYDEVVVYEEEAALPTHLVVYILKE